MNGLISVIVPVYNTKDYLDRCVQSIINQTYHNLEIILVDDGSTDDSGKKCDSWASKDNRIHVIHQKNAGVSAARNAGIEFAHGEYIGFVDSDDYIHEQMYSLLIQAARVNKSAISCCDICTVRDNEEKSKQSDLKNGFITHDEIVKGFLFDEKIKGLMYGIYNKIYKKELFKQLRFEKLSMGEDILFSMQVIQNCTGIYYQNKPLYFYCIRENSAMTSAFSKKRFDYVEAALKIEAICKQHYDKVCCDNAHCWVFLHVLTTYRAMIKNKMCEEYAEQAKQYRNYLKDNKKYLKSLPFKRKIDYFIVLHIPIAYRVYKG